MCHDPKKTKEEKPPCWWIVELVIQYRKSAPDCGAPYMVETADRIFRSLNYDPLDGGKKETAAPSGSGSTAPSSAGPVKTNFGALRRGATAPRKPPAPEPRTKEVSAEQQQKAAAHAAQKELVKAKQYMFGGNLRTAADKINRSLDMYPENFNSHFTFAAVMKLMGSKTDWESHVEKAKELNDKLEKSMKGFMRLGKRKKGGDGADDANLAISDGLIHEAFGRKDKAMDAYGKAIAAAPDNWMPYAYRGILRAENGGCGAAMADFEAAIRLNYLYKTQAQHWINACRQPKEE